jgi:hypothetical protein
MGMATWQETYELLVYNIEATFSDRYNGAYYIEQAELVIVDLTSIDEFGVEAALELLGRINHFYRHIRRSDVIREKRITLVSQINEFTERYIEGDLTTFVNGIDWIDGCVPFNWAETSEESNSVDTSEWTVCS